MTIIKAFFIFDKYRNKKTMTKATHVFKLLSGVEAEIVKFDGESQEAIEEKDGKNILDAIVGITKRIGSVTNRSEIELIVKGDYSKKRWGMLSGDIEYLVLNGRFFTIDRNFKKRMELIELNDEKSLKKLPPSDFVTDYSWTEGSKQMKTDLVLRDLTINSFGLKKYPFQCDEYADCYKHYHHEYNLVDQGINIRYTLLNGTLEKNGLIMRKKKDPRITGSHADLYVRSLQVLTKTKNDEVWHLYDGQVKHWTMADIQDLRADIEKNEGRVDTIFHFDHPEKENERLPVDILKLNSFLYHSMAV